MANELPLLQPEGQVLSTLEADGRRRWLRPKLSKGYFWHRRRVVAYALIAVYTLLPFLKVGGRPALQFDIWGGRLHLFGFTFLPTDMALLALFGLMAFLSIFFATAVFGRVWCGWGCPQTIYMEYVFRPLERLFLGTSGKGGKPPKNGVAAWRPLAMYATYLVICLHLCNTFLAYFVGVDSLHEWIWSGKPWEHPSAFALVLFVTGLMMFDFCYWREQLCIIGCPYGRFQSVMLDKSSLVVGYDVRRGEARGRGRDREAKGLGDCVDCKMCVDVCPTGIDIRNGLQLECVNCTQCIDACDAVMERVGQPQGLIRYSSESAMEGTPTPILRPRVVIYVGIIAVIAGVFFTLLANRNAFDVTLLRGLGRPFVVMESGEVENLIRMKIVNRTEEERSYHVEVTHPPGARLAEDFSFSLSTGATTTEPVRVVAPAGAFAARGGTLEVTLLVTDSEDATVQRNYRLFGPSTAAQPKEPQADTSRQEN